MQLDVASRARPCPRSRLAEEQPLAAVLGGREVREVLVDGAGRREALVVAAAQRHDRAHELRERLGEALFVDRRIAERAREQIRVAGLGPQPFEHARQIHAHLDRILDRHHDHLLERLGARVPEETVVVQAEIRDRHRVAARRLAAEAATVRLPIGERARLLVAARARTRLVARQQRIVEQHAAERGEFVGAIGWGWHRRVRRGSAPAQDDSVTTW